MSDDVARGDVVVPFPSPLVALTEVRSTLLLASVNTLRASGYFDKYRAALAPEYRDTMLEAITGTWVQLPVALAHYRACDVLGLTSLEQMALGRQTGEGIRQHLTRAVGTLSRELGLSPWTAFDHFNRFWARAFRGGGVSVSRRGPKDAEIVYGKCPLLQSPYFRSALRGVAVGLLEFMTHRVFMGEIAYSGPRQAAHYRVAWV